MNRSVSVVGIGRVGLPLALHLARNGFQVYGIDKSKSLVETLRQGRMPFLEELGEAFLRCTLGKTFFPTADPSCIAETDDIIITLGTPRRLCDGRPHIRLGHRRPQRLHRGGEVVWAGRLGGGRVARRSRHGDPTRAGG